jgi:DNA-binding beta-propeller fold protein YncE
MRGMIVPCVSFVATLLAAAVALPGGPPVGMDYLAYDAATDRVWVPAGNTGDVDVVEAATGQVTTLRGFPTAPPRRPDRPRMGPSSATVAEGVVWIGDRADRRLTAYDAKTLARRAVVQLPTMPDGLQFVRRTREVWVTTPGDGSLTIVGLAGKDEKPRVIDTIKLVGAPEGYAVDEARGVFYTNLEDADQTLAIDVATRKVTATWPATCGAEGPRGLAIDEAHRWLFVACTNGARTLDLAHDGKVIGRVDTGAGVDNLAYDVARRRLFVASARAGDLVVAEVAEGGALRLLATVATAPGARNPVVDARGAAYVEDTAGGRLLVVTVPAIKSR